MAPAMTLKIEPELGVPMTPEARTVDLPARADAMANTAEELTLHGLELRPNKEDEEVAAILAMSYAEDPEKTSKKVTHKRAAKLTPPSLVLTSSILQNFGHSVAESATQVRHLVTNKLIEETENPDPRVRIRALELLGKISDVGLFSEKTEITITHQTTDDIKERLRSKLTKLVNPPETDDVVDAVVIDGDEIDIDAEFGLDDAEHSPEDPAQDLDEIEPQAPLPEKADKDLEAAMKEALEDDLVQENDPKWGQ